MQIFASFRLVFVLARREAWQILKLSSRPGLKSRGLKTGSPRGQERAGEKKCRKDIWKKDEERERRRVCENRKRRGRGRVIIAGRSTISHRRSCIRAAIMADNR